ncbi:MAG: hypothetical protein V4671_24065, partial [Armatimonadota bacterium]
KDDAQPFLLTRVQTEKRLAELTAKAAAAWKQGIALAQTPAEKADAHYIEGWGMRLLRRYLTPSESDEEAVGLFVVKGIPSKKEIADAFEKATALAPQNALLWQARADALEPGEEADNAYKKALELSAGKNANLAYLLYNRTAAATSLENIDKWSLALGYLRQAADRDRANAWPLYEEAGILFRYAPYSLTGPSGNPNATEPEKEMRRQAVRNDAARQSGRRAIDLVEDGNRAPRFEAPRYTDSVPKLLEAAWHFRRDFPNDLGNYARVRELARSCSGYAQFMAEFEKQPSEAERALNAVVGLGFRMIGDWPTEDDFATGETIIQGLVGVAVVGIGYKSREKLYEFQGNADKLAMAQAENAHFKLRVDAYRAAVTAALARIPNEFDHY